MSLRKRLVDVAKKSLIETVDSSAEMINDNIVPSFDNMGMASVTPGEFAQEEITNSENLVNTANMSNDTAFDAGVNKDSGEGAIVSVSLETDVVDISAPENDECCGEDECEHKDEKKGIFGESTFAKMAEALLEGKTCEQYLAERNLTSADAGWIVGLHTPEGNVDDIHGPFESKEEAEQEAAARQLPIEDQAEWGTYKVEWHAGYPDLAEANPTANSEYPEHMVKGWLENILNTALGDVDFMEFMVSEMDTAYDIEDTTMGGHWWEEIYDALLKYPKTNEEKQVFEQVVDAIGAGNVGDEILKVNKKGSAAETKDSLINEWLDTYKGRVKPVKENGNPWDSKDFSFGDEDDETGMLDDDELSYLDQEYAAPVKKETGGNPWDSKDFDWQDDEYSDVGILDDEELSSIMGGDKQKRAFDKLRGPRYAQLVQPYIKKRSALESADAFIAELKTLCETGYDGPLDFVPDTRINFTNVLNTLKNELGDDGVALHVDEEYDNQKNKVYKVSQVDVAKLPKKLHVENLILELDGNTYIPNKVSSEFPFAK